MAFDYAKSAATATRLLTNFGQSVTVTRITEGAYDPATGMLGTSAFSQTGIGVLLEYDGVTIGQSQGLIQSNDRKLLLGPQGINNEVIDWYSFFFAPTESDGRPRPNDTATVGGVVYTVMRVKTLAPAGTVVMYELQLRR